MFKLPTYDQIINSIREEEDASLKGNVKLVTPTSSYEIPRKNFEKIRDSDFGIAFIKEQKDEMKWSHDDKEIEDFVLKLIKNKSTNFQFKFSKGTIEQRVYVLKELDKIGMKNYFETTALGINWTNLLTLHTYYQDVLTNDYLCTKLSEIWIRAINKALELNIYAGDFEITNNGKIALNGKDITRDVISLHGKNEEFVDDNNLLINFCLYCDINNYWNKIYKGVILMLSLQDEEQPWKNNILIKEQVCNIKNGNCCYQSTFHRHIKFNLVDYLNVIMN
eukprot:jgi/Orpsp1_1/1175355/evm.model.c7180000053505.1